VTTTTTTKTMKTPDHAALVERDIAPDYDKPGNAVGYLRTAGAVRERAAALLARARRGESTWFSIGDDAALDAAARAVADAARERYPEGRIPFHSRWRHFEAGGIDRRAQLDALLGDEVTPRERARAQIDLALVSVLLDAGAGADWHYVEPASAQRFTRSEGLGVASFHAFTAGLFSSDPDQPLQADAAGLRALSGDRLAEAFQVSTANPLVGLAGRTTLLRRLGEALAQQPEVFGHDGPPRPGGLFDALVSAYGPAAAPTAEVSAEEILQLLLDSLSGIWPSGNALDGDILTGSGDPALALGDCWNHGAARGPGLTDGWVPFHKLSQWLTYSLLEPFEWAGVKVRGIDRLTGLPEYRNGGLFIDTGVIVPRDEAFLEGTWQVGDEFIVEWRALTVALLDDVAPRVRGLLGLSADEMPLACVLEGGTWAAGRALAQRLRAGAPPLIIESDGTVF
jgi:hypothetical protein